ncbi:MAG TPA: hypothetical protein VFT88_00920 [Acidobacteriaceae bacterium]|nr:hypothetical protein [Acidobacteriaceae bacterium]
MSKFAFLSKSVVLSSLALLTAAMLPGASALAQTLPESPGQYALDVYALRGAQDTSAKLYVSVTTNDGQAVASESFDSVDVQVLTPAGQLVSETDYTNIASTGSPAVIDLGDVPLSDVVLVHAKGIAGPDAVPVTLNGKTAVTEFAVNARQIVVPDFEGYGAQMNGYVYTAQNDPSRGFTGNEPPEEVGNLESKVEAMHPGLSRIFLSPAAYLPGNQNLMDSNYKTVELAQKAGADVNITWWFLTHPSNKLTTEEAEVYINTDMQNFAATVNDLVKNHGITVIKELTVQNEPDSVAYIKSNMALYEYAYRQLDMYLKQDGIRDEIKLVGGDLVLNGQAPFFLYMAQHMDDVLDGWSEHIYWNYYDAGYMITRLDGILAYMDTLKSEGYNIKPLSITEYGVRGYKTQNGVALKDPDPYRNGALVATAAGYYVNSDGSLTPVNETNIAGYQQAWFNMVSLNDGFIGMSKWDLYRAQYDFSYQDHSLIGYLFNPAPGQDRWPLRPAYYMEWLMANTTGQHWQVLGQSGSSGADLVTPFRGPNGELTLFAMKTDETAGPITIGDLPRGTEFHVLVWNGDGAGKVTDGGQLNTAGTGTVTVNVPAGGMVALTTMTTAAPPQ